MISTLNTKSISDEKTKTNNPEATDPSNLDKTLTWNYSLSDIHSKLITDLFKKLGLTDKMSSKSMSFVRASSNDKGNISPTDNLTTSSNLIGSNLIGSSPRRHLKRYLTSVGLNSNFQKTTSNNSLPKNRILPNDCQDNKSACNDVAPKKTGLFKKSYSQITKAPFRALDLSQSLKNIPKDNTSYSYFANQSKLNSIQGSVVNLNQGKSLG